LKDRIKLYIAVLDEFPDYMTPTLVAHSVLGAHLNFSERYVSPDYPVYMDWLKHSFRKVVVRVNQKEFDKIATLPNCYLGHENNTLDGRKSCAIPVPYLNKDETPNVLQCAKLWSPIKEQKMPMPSIQVIETKTKEVPYLEVTFPVDYMESFSVNGIEAVYENDVPFVNDGMCKFTIYMLNGRIKDWKFNKSIAIHYKVVDTGTYRLLSAGFNVIASIEEDYAPEILCIDDLGYGDYINMTIDANGYIENFNNTLLDEFQHGV
jgi:hypothetical protein